MISYQISLYSIDAISIPNLITLYIDGLTLQNVLINIILYAKGLQKRKYIP